MTYVTVDVDLSEFATEDLIEELDSREKLRNQTYSDSDELLSKIYELRRLGKDYDKLLDQYIYQKLGRVI